MELSGKELINIMNGRLKKRKDLYWNKKYIIPYWGGLAIAVILCCIMIGQPQEEAYVASSGERIEILEHNTIEVDGITYEKDTEFGNVQILAIIAFFFLVGGMYAYWKWNNDIKVPYFHEFRRKYFTTGQIPEDM